MSDADSKRASGITVNTSNNPIAPNNDVFTDSNEVPGSSRWQNFKNSFKEALPETSDSYIDKTELKDYNELTDVEKAALNSSKTQMKKDLTFRHLMMIVIGGALGTGLFVNSGGSLNKGGPASLVIGWVIIATMMFSTMVALGELCVTFPVTGGFTTYATRFVDPSFGFAMGWNYALQWLILLPLELVAAAITIKYWNHTIDSDAWVAIFYVFIFVLNMLDVKYYAESEVVLSLIKIIAAVGFFILGIVLICGGAPEGGYIGGKYWHDPGAFSHGFKGVCSVFVTAAFSFAGTELIAVMGSVSRLRKGHVKFNCFFFNNRFYLRMDCVSEIIFSWNLI